jgi:transglutaminase/protease-like cytokinesis protein 3
MSGLCQKCLKAMVGILFTGMIAVQPVAVLAQEAAVSDIAGFQEKVVKNMENRETNFTINYTGDTDVLVPDVEDIIKKSYETDDYLRWSWTDLNAKVKGVKGNVDVTFKVSYIATKQQEDYVLQKVKKIVAEILSDNMTELEKVAAIHHYIIKNVAYDHTLKEKSAYGALAKGKTTCQGYAMLLDKMLEEAGINSEIVVGDIPAGLHAWNLVKVGGRWYHIDATNDAANPNPDKYFLVSDKTLKDNNYTWVRSEYPKAPRSANKM